MVDKRFSFAYSFLLSLCIGIMMILMILLFLEYRFFCQQAREMVELKQQYAQYVDVLNQRLSLNDPNSARPEPVEGYLGALEEILQQVQDERGTVITYITHPTMYSINRNSNGISTK